MVADALRAIRDGQEPDTTLKITRSSGAPSAPVTPALAYLIHQWRKNKDTWAPIEVLANEWLVSMGRDGLTERRLRDMLRRV
jgi:hypothetical protein